MRKQKRHIDSHVLINGTELRYSDLERGRPLALRGDVYFALGMLHCEGALQRVNVLEELEAMGYRVYGKIQEEGNVLRIHAQYVGKVALQ